MRHPYPVFDEAFLAQIAAQLSKQRDELDRLRRAVKAASRSPDEKVKSLGRAFSVKARRLPKLLETSLSARCTGCWSHHAAAWSLRTAIPTSALRCRADMATVALGQSRLACGLGRSDTRK